MSTITRRGLEALLRSGQLEVTPLLSQRQVGDSSIDLRLGNQFITFKMHECPAFPGRSYQQVGGRPPSLLKMQERQVQRFGSAFLLHPGMLAMAATLEYVKMPCNLEAQVDGRSSWARVGLQVATASAVEPGFRGVITLELSNVGTIPLEVSPGSRIAQLVFREAAPPVERARGRAETRRKYQCPIGPQFSRLVMDWDFAVFNATGGTLTDGPEEEV